MGLRLHTVEVRSPDDLDAVIRDIPKLATGLFVIEDPLTFQHRKRIAELAVKNQLPSISLFKESTEAGILMSYGASLRDEFRRAAAYVVKILRHGLGHNAHVTAVAAVGGERRG